MDGWHDFFLVEAGAAGVLTGLVFVGVSINLEKILADPRSGLAGRAAETLILLVAVLTASSLLLIPGQDWATVGLEVLAMGTVSWAWIAFIQARHAKNWRAMDPNLKWAFVLRVLLCQASTLPVAFAGVVLVGWGGIGLYWLAAGMIVSVIVALFGAWVLLVEINR